MKNLILRLQLIATLLFAVQANAQTIDTSTTE